MDNLYLSGETHMNEKQKADQLKAVYSELIAQWDIAGYIRDDLEKFARSLNSWKMQSLQRHMWLFKKFVFLLDDQNTKQIGIAMRDNYFMSQRGYTMLSKKKGGDTDVVQSRVVRIMSKIAAMFVFEATEFCNGSADRMCIIDFTKLRAAIVRRMQEVK
jgi:hypothetical protein